MAQQMLARRRTAERRRDDRTSVLWVATMLSAGRSVDCVVMNISDSGAMVRLLEPLRYHARATLLIPPYIGHQQRMFRCEPVWQSGASLGVRFLAG